jgi:hypothetical protein
VEPQTSTGASAWTVVPEPSRPAAGPACPTRNWGDPVSPSEPKANGEGHRLTQISTVATPRAAGAPPPRGASG